MRVSNVLTRQKMQDVLVRCLRLDDTAVNAPSPDDFRALACLWMHIYLLVSLLHTRRRTHLLVYDKYAYVQAHTAHTRTCVRVQALGQDQQLKDTHTHTHTHTHTQTRTGAWQGQGAQGPSGTDAESRAASGVACGRARPCSGRGASVCVYVSMCLSSALALGLYRRSPIFPLQAPL